MTTSASSRSRAIVNRLVSRVRNSVTDFSERGARLTRRDDREYREYLREEQRSQPGCPARKMSANFELATLNSPRDQSDRNHRRLRRYRARNRAARGAGTR